MTWKQKYISFSNILSTGISLVMNMGNANNICNFGFSGTSQYNFSNCICNCVSMF